MGPDGKPMTDILDIKSPLVFSLPWEWWIWALIALGVILIALAVWWFMKRRKDKTTPEPVIPPDQAANEALAGLEKKTDLTSREYGFEISAILRAYLEGRFVFPALEMTTEELSPCLARLGLNSAMASRVRAFLKETDMAKFAGAELLPAKRQDMAEMIKRLVQETRPMEEDDV